MTKNIYLTGFMASGKSTIGRCLAQALHRRFVDMDERLEEQFGRSIPDVFAQLGEETFRAAESALLKKLSVRRRLVVAAGGGAAERNENRRIMRQSGMIVHLAADLSTCAGRITSQERAVRPLWTDEASLRRLFEKRQSAYADCDLTVRVDMKSPDSIARMIIENLIGEERFPVELGSASCPIVATYRAPEAVSEFTGAEKIAVLTDANVRRLHLDRYEVASTAQLVATVRPGERSKGLTQAHRLYDALIAGGFDRDDLLVAIGGGVVTDLGAYVASTYKRGMRFVLVSTTLLGCVDAAVGGKAAVNLGPVKNVVGCFSTPMGVILDMASLSTLKRHHIREGLIEAYKTGLVAAPELADFVEEELPDLLAGDLELLARVAVLSARAKASVVSEDFRESGLRRVLNLGHTVGHVVEGFSRYKTSHGQAVALGIIAAVELSRARGLLSNHLAERIIGTVRRISPARPSLPPIDEAWRLMHQDKKVRSGRVVFVLLEGNGKPVFADDVSQPELANALRAVKQRLLKYPS